MYHEHALNFFRLNSELCRLSSTPCASIEPTVHGQAGAARQGGWQDVRKALFRLGASCPRTAMGHVVARFNAATPPAAPAQKEAARIPGNARRSRAARRHFS